VDVGHDEFRSAGVVRGARGVVGAAAAAHGD
jgi:hypothetical protein